MKKKAIKIAASTAVAASAFVAAAPANKADAAVNVEKLVKDAESAAGALKWAISVEGTADGTTAPVSLYNLTKDANKAAQAAVAKTKGTDKVLYTARLQAVELQISRAMAYIDGITAGKKIAADTAALNAAIAAKDLTKVEAAYHKMTKEYRKQAALLDRVYGQSTRDVIRNATKKPAEAAIETVKIDVTVKMHLDAAAAATKAGDYKKAGESYAKAMEWFDKISATFKDQLTKSKDDVLAALPLQPVSISRVNDTTITVNFNKEVDALAVSHFTFDNGLAVVDAKLSADKKTATVTTTAHENNKTYTLSYKGVKTNLTFVKSVNTDNSGAVDSDATAYIKADASRVITATFKNTDGTPYRGSVKVSAESTIKMDVINGQKNTAAGAVTVVPNADGKITVRITGAAGVSGKLVFERQDNKKEYKSGTTHFVDQFNLAGSQEVEVKYVDKTNKYFVAAVAGGTNAWLAYDSNDSYYDHGSLKNLETFEKDLNKGNKIKVTYNNANNGAGQSDFDIVFKKTITDIDLTTPSVDTTSGNPFRVAANQQFRLTGKGQAGYTVYLYRYDANETDLTKQYKLHGTTTVDGSGYWNYYNINLVKDELAGFRIIQKASGESYTQELASDAAGTNVWLKGGAFSVTTASANHVGINPNNTLDVGESVTFTVTTGDTISLSSPLSITLRDADGTVATYTDGVLGTKIEKVTGIDNQFKVTFGSTNTIGGGNGVMAGSFTVTQFQGVTNQHGLGLSADVNVSGL